MVQTLITFKNFTFGLFFGFLRGDPQYELQGGADLSFKMVR